jgi:hypothetical protein
MQTASTSAEKGSGNRSDLRMFLGELPNQPSDLADSFWSRVVARYGSSEGDELGNVLSALERHKLCGT